MVATIELILHKRTSKGILKLVAEDNLWHVFIETESNEKIAFDSFSSKDEAIMDYLKKVHLN